MLLRARSLQLESLDSPGRPVDQIADDYAHLARMNRVCSFALPFIRGLPRLLGQGACQDLTLLDVGGGDGYLGRELTKWAGKRKWVWRVTNLDVCPISLGLNHGGRNVVGSALSLPFADQSFDVVIASQMTHHLGGDPEISRHFREAWRVARRAVIISDLHRNLGLFALVWIMTRILKFPPNLADDGTTSVRRGFRLNEWQELAHAAGIPNAKVRLFFGTRILLEASKGEFRNSTHTSGKLKQVWNCQ